MFNSPSYTCKYIQMHTPPHIQLIMYLVTYTTILMLLYDIFSPKWVFLIAASAKLVASAPANHNKHNSQMNPENIGKTLHFLEKAGRSVQLLTDNDQPEHQE